jgi:hypothetical protein
MEDTDRHRLLFGPYRPLPLARGSRAFCLLRDCPVIITSWTDAPIPWPRCRALDGPGGGSGILLDEELARAVRHESAAAMCYWWGVSEGVVWRWRKALAVTRTSNDGTRRLIRASAKAGAADVRGRTLPPDQIERRRQTALALNLARFLRSGYHGPRWTAGQLRLLGRLPDAEVAAKIGRTPNAVRVKRSRQGIPSARDARRRVQGE